MSGDQLTIDTRGTYFTFQNFLETIEFRDTLVRQRKIEIYREIVDVFPVDLSLMLAYESPLASSLDVDRFWPYFYQHAKDFSSSLEGGEFYVYLDTFPDKILLEVDSEFLTKILSFDLFSFEYFVCDTGYTSYLMETKRDMIFSSGIFLNFFSDLIK